MSGRGSILRRGRCSRRTEACDFWNWGEGAVRPDCCTEHLLELAFFLEDLMNENDVPHWLDWGSLLGAVRNEELIPWDDDADFGILMANVPRLIELGPAIERAGHVFDVRRSEDGKRVTRVRVSYSRANSLHVGFFPWTEEGDLVVSDMNPDSVWPGMHGAINFPRRCLDAPEWVTLHGKRFPAPSPVGRFLADHRFGRDYMTPRRRVRRGLYPNFGQDEMTPVAAELLDRIAERQEYLYSRWPQKVDSTWRRWTNPGLPPAPAPQFVEAVRHEVPAGERSDVVEQLIESLALVEHAIAEIDGPASLRRERRERRRKRFKRNLRKRIPALAGAQRSLKRRRRKRGKARKAERKKGRRAR